MLLCSRLVLVALYIVETQKLGGSECLETTCQQMVGRIRPGHRRETVLAAVGRNTGKDIPANLGPTRVRSMDATTRQPLEPMYTTQPSLENALWLHVTRATSAPESSPSKGGLALATQSQTELS